MKTLTVKILRECLKDMPDDTIVYIGDDEELNGIHNAFFVQEIDDEYASSVSLGPITKGGILIS